MKLEDLLQKRKQLSDEARGLLDAADTENRDLSRAENGRYQEIETELDSLDERIGREQRARDRERRLAEKQIEGRVERLEFELGRPDGERNPAEIRRLATLPAEVRMVDWVRARYEVRAGADGIGGDELPGPADFSLARMIRAQIDPSARRDLNEHELRALGEGADATGGVMVPEILAADVIDRLRSASVVLANGGTVVPMESDTTVIARLAGGSTANWRTEGSGVTESDQSFERVELKAKTAAIMQRASFELFEDMSPAGEATVRNELAAARAVPR